MSDTAKKGGGLKNAAGILVLLLGLGAVGLAVAGAFGYKYGYIDLGTALLKMNRWAFYLAAGALVLGLATVMANLVTRPMGGMLKALTGMVLAGAFLALLIPQVMTARSLPRIHDVTTDTQTPPAFVDLVALRDAECERKHNGRCNSNDYDVTPDYLQPEDGSGAPVRIDELQREAYPDIETLVLDASYDDVFQRAIDVAQELGWQVVAQRLDQGRIEATQTSFWYGFTDDIVIRIEDTDGGQVRVDIRSKSRIGQSDVGANARRIRAFLERMEA